MFDMPTSLDLAIGKPIQDNVENRGVLTTVDESTISSSGNIISYSDFYSAILNIPEIRGSIRSMTNTLSKMQIEIIRNGDDVTEQPTLHPLAFLWRRPNFSISGFQFWRNVFYRMLVNRVAHVRIFRDEENFPVALRIADNVTWNETEQTWQGQMPEFRNERFGPLPDSNMLVFSQFDFDIGRKTILPLSTLCQKICDVLANAAEANGRIVMNGMNGIYVFRQTDGVRGLSVQQKADLQNYLTQLETQSPADHNAKVFRLPAGLEVSTLTNTDMATLVQSNEDNLYAIARIIGIPPRMLYKYEKGQRNQFSYSASQNDYFTESIEPNVNTVLAELNHKFMQFGRYPSTTIRLNEYSFIIGTMEERTRVAKDRVQAGIWSRNDGRRFVGSKPYTQKPDNEYDDLASPAGAPPIEEPNQDEPPPNDDDDDDNSEE